MNELERYLFDLQGFLVVENVILEPPYIWKRPPVPMDEGE